MPGAVPPAWQTSGGIDRHEQVPGDFVTRPLTLPAGTFSLAFTHYAAFVDAAQSVGWMPSFAVGVTADFELGLHIPLRYDEGVKDWTVLDPLPHLAFTWFDTEALEAAFRMEVLLPATSEAGSYVGLGAPLLWRINPALRLDFGAEVQLGLQRSATSSLRIPVGLTAQATPWLFAGLQAMPNVGLSNAAKTGVDGQLTVGLTLQTRETAQLDVVARFFVENVGAADDDKFSDGAGTIISVGFFPELY